MPLKIKYKGRSGEETVATNEVAVEIKGLLKEGEAEPDIRTFALLWTCRRISNG